MAMVFRKFCSGLGVGVVCLFAAVPVMAESSVVEDAPPPPTGQIYKAVDPKTGKTVYTDKAIAGAAEAVKLSPGNTLQAPSPAAPRTAKAKAFQYEQFELAQPDSNAVFGNEVEAVVVSVVLTPGLQKGDTVQFFYDDQPVGEPGVALSTEITALERGSHTVEARLFNDKGALLLSTGAVTFHVQRHSTMKDGDADAGAENNVDKEGDNDKESDNGKDDEADSAKPARPARGVGTLGGAGGAGGAGSATNAMGAKGAAGAGGVGGAQVFSKPPVTPPKNGSK